MLFTAVLFAFNAFNWVYFGCQRQRISLKHYYFRENKRAIYVFIQEAVYLYTVSYDAQFTFHWNYIFEFQSGIKKTKRVLKHTT